MIKFSNTNLSSYKLLKLAPIVKLEKNTTLYTHSASHGIIKRVIRGTDGDEAVLCSENATFKMSNQQSSNTLLPIRRSYDNNAREQEDFTALSLVHNVWETSQILPKLYRLQTRINMPSCRITHSTLARLNEESTDTVLFIN